MTIRVENDWWKTLFDEIYLLTDARSVGDETVTRREIDIFCRLVPLAPGDRILDLCGGHGRHALELCRRGHTGCTVFDWSSPLLAVGRQTAEREGLGLAFVQGDARQTALPSGAFDHVLILGNSLGYIREGEADLAILRESRRLLKPGGWLLLDVADGQVAGRGLAPEAWHEIGADVVVCRRRERREGCIFAREMVLSKRRGMLRDQTYAIRLYTADGLRALVSRAGYRQVRVHDDFSVIDPRVDVGCMNHRLVAVARTPPGSQSS